jgi:hypothetical protein
MEYKCNACADTENYNAPCIVKVHEALGKPPIKYCPATGKEADWNICEEQPAACPHHRACTDGIHVVVVDRCYHPDRDKWAS